jgi:hypothetical protein
MDYKKLIIELLNKITDDKRLEYIYLLIKKFAERNG